ncbi:hypothetical protein [Rufibacter quisquiliarum]|uniref:Uncharacterized protein n=1 Tax=Rufibacter quisquiliarum TaxID=1549639 RepID=A0A839GTD3_9BACT|nr:hypothetical protein [Rufibacter quisquiliarum]MBA9078066.1 hypothetical protein [Rufibacter quisquiliarum]
MKRLLLVFLLLGAVCSYEAAAQDANAKPIKVKLGKTSLSVHPDASYFVKLEDRTIELEQLALDQIDQAWIAAAEALKPEQAMEAFGDKGEYGVVLITFTKKNEAEALKLIQDVKRRKM